MRILGRKCRHVGNSSAGTPDHIGKALSDAREECAARSLGLIATVHGRRDFHWG